MGCIRLSSARKKAGPRAGVKLISIRAVRNNRSFFMSIFLVDRNKFSDSGRIFVFALAFFGLSRAAGREETATIFG